MTHDPVSGETESFESFVASASPRLIAGAWLIVGDRGAAEDLAQEALERTYLAWNRIRSRDASYAYAYKTLMRLAWRRSHDLRRRRSELTADSIADPREPTERSSQQEALQHALAQIPIKQRQVLVLRYFCDLDINATAAVLGRSAGTIKAQTHTGLVKLRQLLSDPHLPAGVVRRVEA